jgi:hypothetical protein
VCERDIALAALAKVMLGAKSRPPERKKLLNDALQLFNARAAPLAGLGRPATASDPVHDLACEMVRELMQGLTHADRGSLVKVRDETRPMVFSIPFFAACA